MANPFNEIEDNIRPPDEVRSERLIEDNRSEFEKQIDEALYSSIEEFNKQKEFNDKYEEELKNDYLNKCKKRKETFEGFLFSLKKLIKYDKEIKEIYNIIEPIIDSYCSQYIEVCQLDPITFDKIFSVLSKTRTNKETIEILKTIILTD